METPATAAPVCRTRRLELYRMELLPPMIWCDIALDKTLCSLTPVILNPDRTALSSERQALITVRISTNQPRITSSFV